VTFFFGLFDGTLLALLIGYGLGFNNHYFTSLHQITTFFENIICLSKSPLEAWLIVSILEQALT